MIKELSNKYIYDDFIYKTTLTDIEKDILDRLIRKETIIKISMECNLSDRSVSRIVRDLKEKYDSYRKIEMAKLGIFLK